MIDKYAAIEAAKKLRKDVSRASLTQQIKTRILLSEWAIEELERQKKPVNSVFEKVSCPGFYRKYQISKFDGTPIDFDAEYFVLRIDGGGTDRVHVEACRKAIEAYAAAVDGTHLSEMGEDLLALVNAMRRNEK